MTASTGGRRAPVRPGAAPTPPAWPWAALTAALFATGAVMSALRRTDVDIAWLLTLGEKMLAGQRPYIDVFEANPPMSILLYLPAVIAGHGLGVSADAMVDVLTLLAIAASLALSGLILASSVNNRATLWKLAAAGAFVLTVLPTGVFGQREHIAVIAMLPFLAGVIVRGAGRPPSASLAAIAGLGCGVAMAIKPHFALAAGGALMVQAWRLRSLRPLLALEVWAASLVVGLYALVVVIFFPGFLAFLPVIRDAYLPVRQPLVLLLLWPPVPVWLILGALAALVAWRRPGGGWPAASLLAASVGAFASYLIQGKGWPYHSYPMLALAALALGVALGLGRPAKAASVPVARRAARIGLIAAGLVFVIGALGASMRWFTLKGDFHALDAPVAAISAHPRLLTIGADIAVGEPLVRELHGRWVGSVCSQWISAGAMTLEHRGRLSPARRARLEALMAFDRGLLAHDIVAGRPDVILISTGARDWLGWARRDPALAAALDAYRPLQTVEGVAIWSRRPPA